VIMNGHRDLMDLISAVAVAMALFGCDRSPTTVDAVIERHTKAMGGRAAIEAIQSIEFDLHITDPKFEVDGTYFAARPGKKRIDGISYYVLRLTLNDGYCTTLYVDPKTWLITRRRDVRPLHVDVDPTPMTIEQRNSDFRTVAGVQLAFASNEIDLQSGKVLESAVIRGVKINPPLVSSIFEKL